ncbi:hypothetical protein NE236_40655 [Actinoallomurus purpureus]|uniref:hypothetical protein n=1 Tax=Actinoallomurus purpureus TaxID=478114 RepID=UPI002093DD3A|nr:hypothetical protein [Actinoallomurus purpureus]MCO6011280.1 hypothetical protein [Actinoallomurus purpureus]
MEHKSDFPVPVAAAPAFLIAALAAVSAVGSLLVLVTVGYLLLAMRRLSEEAAAGAVFVIFPLVGLALLASAVGMAFLARSEFRLLRTPPVFTSAGVRLRVFARRGYDVFVPWDRVSRLRVAEKGPRPYLLVDVADAEDLAGGDPGRAERLRRTAERFEGAAFVYGLRGALIGVEELGAVVHRLSDGTVALDY